jgi:hypothetical protein
VLELDLWPVKLMSSALDHSFLISTSRFFLRDKVTLRLLKLYFNIADVAGWCRALDIRLSDWCCSVSMVSVINRTYKYKTGNIGGYCFQIHTQNYFKYFYNRPVNVYLRFIIPLYASTVHTYCIYKVILNVPNEGYWAYLMKVILSVPDEGYFERT